MPLGKLFKKKEKNELDDEAELLSWSEDEEPDDEDEEAGPTPIVLPNVVPVAGVEPDSEDVEAGEDSLEAIAPLEENPQKSSADDQMLGIFEEEVVVDENLQTLTCLVEEITAGDLFDEIQAFIEELARL